MKKRWHTWIIILFILVMIITGCVKEKTNPEEAQSFDKKQYDWGNISGKTITIWGDKDDFSRIYVKRAVERYQEKTGNTILIRELSKQDIDKMVPQAFSSESEERPDIYVGYGGVNIGNLNADENFYDFINAEWMDDLTDTVLTQAIYNGRVIGLPAGEASVSGTLYKKELFQRLRIEIPKTQEEFLEVCEILLQNGVTPMYLPYADITMLLYQFPMDSIVKNSKILDGLNDGSISYSEIPEMKKIVEWYKTMADRGYFGKDYKKNDWNGMDDAMKNDALLG